MSDEGDRKHHGGFTGGPLPAGGSRRPCVLTINGGSSSLKFAVFAAAGPARTGPLRARRAGRARGIAAGRQRCGRRPAGGSRGRGPGPGRGRRPGDRAGRTGPGLAAIAAVGHRVVHGGDRFVEPALVTAEMLDELRRISPLDPDHLPGRDRADRGVRAAPSRACRRSPASTRRSTATCRRPAQIVPIPRRYGASGVRRYGFHGLSYAYLMEELARVAGPEEARAGSSSPTSARARAWRRSARAGASTRRWASRPPPAWSWAPAPATSTPGSSRSSPTPRG